MSALGKFVNDGATLLPCHKHNEHDDGHAQGQPSFLGNFDSRRSKKGKVKQNKRNK